MAESMTQGKIPGLPGAGKHLCGGNAISGGGLGDRAVDGICPMIQSTHAAMVGFGQLTKRPRVDGGTVLARRTITATLAGDHRVSDGRRGALFLEKLAEFL